ncbi:hypothetical protein WJX84_011589 [Apatococcus fuscideae]|uniref:CCR4-NOT transcription complex subunit 3 n=1 Tax=Apatococcus fuscideae TaxID=2026836 RepID=A0AAW1T8N4_9CHLO
MGANRKLQAEIDRTLKRVAEGIDVFDQIWEKRKDFDTGTNPAQKEKYEADLKKEIKKLQRYRDQIKTWIGNADIKDKNDLVNARKAVEREMERFKDCEKETKTKAFSKEGLARDAKQDPKDKHRAEMREWINTIVEDLHVRVESLDAEIEGMANPKKKAKPLPKLLHLEEATSRHKQHIVRLEQVLRLMENEEVQPEEVQDEVKPMIEDYMERGEDDFDEFADVDGLYPAALIEQLDSLETQMPVTGALQGVKEKDKGDRARDKDREREAERQREKDRAAAKAVKEQLAEKAAGGLKPIAEEEEPAPSPAKPSVAMKTRSSADKPLEKANSGEPLASPRGLPAPSAASTSTPKIAGPTPQTVQAAPAPLAPISVPRMRQDGFDIPPSPSPAASDSSMLSSATAATAASKQEGGPKSQAEDEPRGQSGAKTTTGPVPSAAAPRPPAGPWGFSGTDTSAFPQLGEPRVPEAVPGESRKKLLMRDHSRPAAPEAASMQRRTSIGSATGSSGATSSDAHAPASNAGVPPDSPSTSSRPSSQDTGAEQLSQAASMAVDSRFPTPQPQLPELGAAAADLGPHSSQGQGPGAAPSSPGAAPDGWDTSGWRDATVGSGIAPVPLASPAENLRLLQACVQRSIPSALDSVWPTMPLRMKHNPGAVPASYPTQKLSILDNPALFEKLDSEALFFAFYYQPGSLQQYLAARELKRQSWRYHKQHGAWFQRHEEPKQANDEFEQGTYVYFDYNILHDDLQSGWCYRLKQDFTFKYDALEDELQL